MSPRSPDSASRKSPRKPRKRLRLSPPGDATRIFDYGPWLKTTPPGYVPTILKIEEEPDTRPRPTPLAEFDLVALRISLGLSKPEMAKRMELSLRRYQELEKDRSQMRDDHKCRAEGVATDEAIDKGNPLLAPPHVRDFLPELAKYLALDRAAKPRGG